MSTVGDVLALVEVFREMSQSRMSVTLGVKVADTIDEFNRVLSVFDEQRKKIIEDDSKTEDEKLQEINALLAETIDLSSVELTIEDVEHTGVRVTPAVAKAMSRVLRNNRVEPEGIQDESEGEVA